MVRARGFRGCRTTDSSIFTHTFGIASATITASAVTEATRVLLVHDERYLMGLMSCSSMFGLKGGGCLGRSWLGSVTVGQGDRMALRF